jgi:4-amino-4-deoxy-L-arabinose transferase-like glycosyltransferase
MSKELMGNPMPRANRILPRTDESGPVLPAWLLLAMALAAALPLLAIVTPVNHDETQYIAAAQLVSEGLMPFRDFLYLQTPYQVFVFAPVFGAFGEGGFIAARVLTGLIGAGTAALVFAALRAAGVERARAAVCAILMVLCHAFVFGVTVVRNDAVPALLLAGALALAAWDLGRAAPPAPTPTPTITPTPPLRVLPWLAGGVLLGLATGTKISYLAAALAFAGFPVWAALLKAMPLRDALGRAAAAAVGLVAALAPLLWLREAAPVAFDYGNFGYHAEAPLAWYAANGLGERLTLVAKLRDVLLTLVRGPALFALLAYGWWRWQGVRAGERQRALVLLVDVLILAGLAATIAPTPTWRQYAVPLLPPLFVGLGLAWQDRAAAGARIGKGLAGAMGLAALVGIGQPLFQLWQGTIGPAPTPLSIAREGAMLAREAARRGLDGPAESLSPEVLLAAGLPFGPVFATGPFAYRTADAMAPERRAALHITAPESVAAYLAATRPEVIVTGYENFDHVDKQGLEQPIEGFAVRNAYVRIDSPHGDAVFWLRPTPSSGPGPAR